MSSDPRAAPYGTWKSPISADMMASGGVTLDDVLIDTVTSQIYHVENRPSEGGRNVIVKTKDNLDIFEREWNARTGVHEYGGSASIVRDGLVFFSNYHDSRVYKLTVDSDAKPSPITPENKNHRFANFAIHPVHSYWIIAVFEDHTRPDPADVVNALALIDTRSSNVSSSFISGADFYASPTFSPDGSKLAWIEWYHPDMPWQGGQICVAYLEEKDGNLAIRHRLKIAGEKSTLSAAHPSWIDDQTLAFTYDLSDYRNLWVCKFDSQDEVNIKPACSDYIDEDFGYPLWRLGDTSYAILSSNIALCSAYRGGRTVLYQLDLLRKTKKQLECPYVQIQWVRRLSSDSVVFLGAKADEAMAVVLCNIHQDGRATYSNLKSSSLGSVGISSDVFSKPRPISLIVPPSNEPLHLVFYPPTNPAFIGLQDEKPPAIINCHGGPTGLSQQGLDWSKQFFTSRGWAFIDVNYGGSACYGRKYVDRLTGKWGITDVQDCVQAALQLSSPVHDLIDRKRAVIRGGSAGGYTTLASMCAAFDVFSAGASTCGISDLAKLEEFTHKFESMYLVGLMGGRYAEIPNVYKARSPVHNADKINSPLMLLQGSKDVVVHPTQAESIVDAIQKRSGRVEYVVFEGEGHGWRRSDTIKAAFEKELAFFMDVLGLKEDE